MMIRRHLSLTAVALTLGLAGCTGNPTVTPPANQPALNDAADTMAQVERLLEKAESAAPIRAARLKADAARTLISLNRKQDASRVLSQINTTLLPPGLAFEITAMQAEDALSRQQPEQALQYLTQPRSEPLADTQALELSQLRLQAYSQSNNPVGETRELINQSRFSETPSDEHKDRIWSSLSRLPADTISQLTQDNNNNYQEQGWFELADGLHKSGDLEQKSNAISRWRTLWENHPASNNPPSALEALSSQNRDIRHIALLLPQSGPLSKPARAISEGFLTAYYNAQSEGNSVPRISLLDASSISEPYQLSNEINLRQIDMVIGPLDKTYVQKLSNAADITTPILALNYSESSNLNSNLFQFGLSAEDEARQAAQQAWGDGRRQAAILTADTNWGRKVANAFREEFTRLGGEVHTHAQFSEGSYDLTISQLMNTDQSRARAKIIRKLVRKKVEFEEHRRQDLDMVFLSALPNDARQINPTLSFHYANDLPVYATSHAYGGQPNAMTDQDLTGIRFIDSPWSLAPPSTNKRSLSQQRKDVDSRFGRLYALGLDAFQLHPYLLQLAALPQSSIEGETGRLSVAGAGRVKRTLNWAIFDQGVPRLLARPTQKPETQATR